MKIFTHGVLYTALFAIMTGGVFADVTKTSSFQNVFSVSFPEIQTPTVIEVPLDGVPLTSSTFAVFDETEGVFTEYRYSVENRSALNIVSVSSSPSVTNANVMTDGSYETASEFPITEQGVVGTVQIILTASSPVTTSALAFSFPQYVTNPETISIEVEKNGVREYVVAQKRFQGAQVTFPETTASRWTVTLTHSQPLRISEIKFAQNRESLSSHEKIRFLAQPGHAYMVYINPDIPNARVDVAYRGSNLALNRDIHYGSVIYPILPNEQFRPSDTDNDSIPDIYDNCPRVPNPDQADTNRNGVGDVCDDFDKDGHSNVNDNCPNHPNPDQRDTDGDGIGDVCDTEESRFTEKNKWVPWVGIGIAGITFGLLIFMAFKMKAPDQQEENNGVSSQEPPQQ